MKKEKKYMKDVIREEDSISRDLRIAMEKFNQQTHDILENFKLIGSKSEDEDED